MKLKLMELTFAIGILVLQLIKYFAGLNATWFEVFVLSGALVGYTILSFFNE